MELRNIGKQAKRAIAIGGIIGNLNATPTHGLNTPATQIDQWTKYSKNVRGPETRRQIKRDTEKKLKEVAALDKRTKKQIKKTK